MHIRAAFWLLLPATVLGGVTDKQSDQPLWSKPYQISVWLSYGEDPRFTPSVRSALQQEFDNYLKRFFGPVIEVEYVTPPPQLLWENPPLPQEMAQVREQTTPPARGNNKPTPFDKQLWFWVGQSAEQFSSGDLSIPIKSREYDYEFGSKDLEFGYLGWGPPSGQTVVQMNQVARTLVELFYQSFRPNLLLLGPGVDRKDMPAVIQGMGVQPVDSPMPIVKSGMPFQLYRDAWNRETYLGRQAMDWTYLIVSKVANDRQTVRCELISGLREHPLPARSRLTFRCMGVAARTSQDATTIVNFRRRVTPTEQQPVEGLEVALRLPGELTVETLGNTDRLGRYPVTAVKLVSKPDLDVRSQVFEVQLRMGKLIAAKFPLLPGHRPQVEVPVRMNELSIEMVGRMEALLTSQVMPAIIKRKAKEAEVKRLVDQFNEAQTIEAQKEIRAKIDVAAKEWKELPDEEDLLLEVQKLEDFANQYLVDHPHMTKSNFIERTLKRAREKIKEFLPPVNYVFEGEVLVDKK